MPFSIIRFLTLIIARLFWKSVCCAPNNGSQGWVVVAAVVAATVEYMFMCLCAESRKKKIERENVIWMDD